jgi:hypothetical protein
MEIKKRNSIIFFGAFFLILILTGIIGYYYHLKKDYTLNVNFLVAEKKVNAKGHCTLFDEEKKELPIRSFSFFESEVYVGDSIVKESNSYLVYVYRKKKWRYEVTDNTYFIAEKINLN